MIPKIIHQVWINDTWLGNEKKNVPKKWEKSIIEWKRLHPDWQHILWTDDMILIHLETYHPEYLEFYKSYPYLIQRADMIRYFILYDMGGIYCDLDSYPSKNIESYLTCDNMDYFVYTASVVETVMNAFMVCQKNSLIMKSAIDKLKDSFENLPWFAFGKHMKVMHSTGPNFLHHILLNGTVSYVILPRYLFCPYSSSDDKMLYENYEQIVIQPIKETSGSWHSYDSIIFAFINRHRPVFILIGIVSIFLIIFGLFYYLTKYKNCERARDKCENKIK